MNIQQHRLNKGWSQELLAEMAGLSTRTIQRIENGDAASAESLKALAAVFEIPLSQLQTISPDSAQSNPLTLAERQILRDIKSLRGFYIHLFFYVTISILLFVINFSTYSRYIWAVWPLLGWGIGIAFHGMLLFKPFKHVGREWEHKQFEKRKRATHQQIRE